MTLYEIIFVLGSKRINTLLNAPDKQSVTQELNNKINNDEVIRHLFDTLSRNHYDVKQMLINSLEWVKCGFLEFCNR